MLDVVNLTYTGTESLPCGSGSISRAVEQLIMCWATNKVMVIVGVVFGAFAALLMPASCALLSKHTPPWEQVVQLIDFLVDFENNSVYHRFSSLAIAVGSYAVIGEG